MLQLSKSAVSGCAGSPQKVVPRSGRALSSASLCSSICGSTEAGGSSGSRASACASRCHPAPTTPPSPHSSQQIRLASTTGVDIWALNKADVSRSACRTVSSGLACRSGQLRLGDAGSIHDAALSLRITDPTGLPNGKAAFFRMANAAGMTSSPSSGRVVFGGPALSAPAQTALALARSSSSVARDDDLSGAAQTAAEASLPSNARTSCSCSCRDRKVTTKTTGLATTSSPKLNRPREATELDAANTHTCSAAFGQATAAGIAQKFPDPLFRRVFRGNFKFNERLTKAKEQRLAHKKMLEAAGVVVLNDGSKASCKRVAQNIQNNTTTPKPSKHISTSPSAALMASTPTTPVANKRFRSYDEIVTNAAVDRNSLTQSSQAAAVTAASCDCADGCAMQRPAEVQLPVTLSRTADKNKSTDPERPGGCCDKVLNTPRMTKEIAAGKPSFYKRRLVTGAVGDERQPRLDMNGRLVDEVADSQTAETAASTHRTPDEFDLVIYTDAMGKSLLRDVLSGTSAGPNATAADLGEHYLQLSAQFLTQEDPPSCGRASLAMVLNSLGVDPQRVWKGVWRWYSEDMLVECSAQARVDVRDGLGSAKAAERACCASGKCPSNEKNLKQDPYEVRDPASQQPVACTRLTTAEREANRKSDLGVDLHSLAMISECNGLRTRMRYARASVDDGLDASSSSAASASSASLHDDAENHVPDADCAACSPAAPRTHLSELSNGANNDSGMCTSKKPKCESAARELERQLASNASEFREDVKNALRNANARIIVAYSRQVLGQTGTGHYSPIAAYHEETDRMLVMDVARFKYPPYWVKTSLLWSAMCTIDQDTQKPRGYLLCEWHGASGSC